MTPVNLPPPIPAYEPDTFAHFTVHKRLPAILNDVRTQFHSGMHDPRWSSLESALLDGGTIDEQLINADTAYWRRRLGLLSGRNWSALPFFDLEFLFYRAINSIAHDLQPGFDVFAATRRQALASALPDVEAALATSEVTIERALRLATFGNEVDLSQLSRGDAPARSDPILIDETTKLGHVLREATGRAVAILADNAGTELCFDLVLVDTLLFAECGPVELHLKPGPMFVSDALIDDVERTIAAFERQPAAGALVHIGERLRHALRDGRVLLRAAADWAEPRHMNMLSQELTASLQAASVVLAKGDLNYRRFFEDRAWPPHSPVAGTSVATKMRAFALRVLKSDTVVGVPAERVAQLFAAEPAWRSSGRYALVQRVDREAGVP